MFGLGVPEFVVLATVGLIILWVRAARKMQDPPAGISSNTRDVPIMLIPCPACKKEVSNQAISCPNCGQTIAGMSQQSSYRKSTKSRSLAIFLSLLLGGIGAHKFYLDKPGVGLLYLIFVWTFIPSVLGLFEALQYLSMNDAVFQKRYEEKKL